MDKLTTEQREIALRLQMLQDHEIDNLEREREKIQQTYKNYIPDMLARVQEQTGIAQKDLIDNAVKATSHYENLKWYDYLQTMYIFNLRLKEQKGKENANS